MSRPLAVLLAATLLGSGPAPLAAGAPALLRQQQAEARVIGRMVDARTEAPLSSVRVSVGGTELGVLTNADGRYELLGVAAGTHDIRAQRIGYHSSTETVDVSSTGAATVNFGLGEQALALEQVVVTGTGSQARRREVGNPITQINLSSVADPTKSVETLLQARVPGMTVDVGGATIGQGATIRLRGNVSLSQSNQPLVYVDGVRQTANNYPRNVSQGGSTFNAAQVEASPLADIDAGDIDRVEVIKGAAAATVYGAGAAAGVIEIFPKHGTAGKTAFTFRTDQGINWMRPYGSDVRPLLNMEPWLKQAYGHREALSVSGGSDQAQYYLSSLFDDKDGVLPQDHERRYRIRGNLMLQPLANLTLQWNSFVSKNDLAMSPDGNGGESIPFNVYRSPVTSLGAATPENIAKLLTRTTTQTDDRLIVGASATWVPFGWMSHKFTFGYDRAAMSGEVFHPYGFVLQSLVAWKDRYFLTGGLRVDGSSAFGRSFGLQAYPKLSASYVISDEPFWPATLGTAKLRAAYGFAGRAPGVFDAARTWSAGAFAGQGAFLPNNLGNPALGPEKSGELEVGVDAAALDDRLSLTFTYYHRHTVDALLAVPQAASNGVGATPGPSQLENVGELSAGGIEASLEATVLRGSWLTWDLGSTISTNHTNVLSTGGKFFYNIVPGQPAPAWRGAKVTNRDAFADPVYQLDAFFGSTVPTVIINPFMTLKLPHGLLLSARGEYQGGAWGQDFPSRLVAQRGPRGPVGCDDVYKIVPWASYTGPGDPNAPAAISQVRALDRARCYKKARSDVWFMPLDFFKLREVTLQAPIPTRFIPRATSAFASLSFHNIWRWTNSEFASFDPELVGSRDNVNQLFSMITDQLPPPATATFSLKLTF